MDKVSLTKKVQEIKLTHPEYKDEQILSCLKASGIIISLKDLQEVSLMTTNTTYTDTDLGLAVQRENGALRNFEETSQQIEEKNNTLRNIAIGTGAVLLTAGTFLFGRRHLQSIKNIAKKSEKIQQTYIPTQLKEYAEAGIVPKKFFSKILNDSTLDITAKKGCLEYTQRRIDTGVDKLSRYFLEKKANKTVNKVIKNPDIDKRVISEILGSHEENEILENYKKLSRYELDPMIRYVLARAGCFSPDNIEKYNDFSKTMLSLKEFELQDYNTISDFLKFYNKEFDITKLTEYIKSIDMSKLLKLEPSIKEYSTRQLIDFFNYHRQIGTKNFTKETLTYTEDLTKFLENQPMGSSDGMHELLTAYPMTKTRIGRVPDFWNLNEAESKKVFETTEEFANKCEVFLLKAVSTEYQASCIKNFESKLSNILGKEAKISTIGSGNYGSVYKISVKDSKPLVIKLFFDEGGNIQCGPLIEPANASFASKHFPEHFAKFYYGKIPSKNNEKGFMVSEFLSPTPPQKFPQKKDPKYDYFYADGSEWNDHSGNLIGGKIADIGCLKILDKLNNYQKINFSLFEPWQKISH